MSSFIFGFFEGIAGFLLGPSRTGFRQRGGGLGPQIRKARGQDFWAAFLNCDGHGGDGVLRGRLFFSATNRGCGLAHAAMICDVVLIAL